MLKRAFDFSLSLIGIVLSIPLWILISLAILLEDGLPVFYVQERIGKGGRVFKAIKFRSMIKEAEKDVGPVQAVENDPRATKVGKILRATAMDELPQLINILKGDMSFVGPRALRWVEIENRNVEIRRLRDHETENQKLGDKDYGVRGRNHKAMPLEGIPGYHERQSVRPGLTGLAQVYLPTDAPRPQKFHYDLLYLEKRSFWLDIKLILLSFFITFRGQWESRDKKL